MPKVKIITDSSCDFSKEYAESLGIALVDLPVFFGTRNFEEEPDRSTSHFWGMVRTSHAFPTALQPSPQDFLRTFLQFEDFDDILCITVSSKSSQTFHSACLARQMLIERGGFAPHIHVVDSQNASIGLGLMARQAANLAQQGQSAPEIMRRLEFMRTRLSLYFVLDSLEYVHHAGRVGALKAFLGQTLKIKPVLTLLKGVPVEVSKTLGISQAMQNVIDRFASLAASHSEVAIVHAHASSLADALAKKLKALYQNIKIERFEAGPAIASLTGPGGIGLAFLEKSARFA